MSHLTCRHGSRARAALEGVSSGHPQSFMSKWAQELEGSALEKLELLEAEIHPNQGETHRGGKRGLRASGQRTELPPVTDICDREEIISKNSLDSGAIILVELRV